MVGTEKVAAEAGQRPREGGARAESLRGQEEAVAPESEKDPGDVEEGAPKESMPTQECVLG